MAKREDTRDTTPRRWLNELAKGVRGWLWLASLLGIAAGLLTIVQMGLLAWIVSQVIVEGAGQSQVGWAFLGLVVVLVVRALAQWGQEIAGFEAGVRVRDRVRNGLLDHLARLGPVTLRAYHSGGVAGRLMEQVEALEGYFSRFLIQLRLSVALPVLILGVVAWLDWVAALFLLVSAPLIPLFMALIGMGAERLQQEQFAAVTRLAGHFLDRVRGLTTLQLFNHAKRSIDEVYLAADEYRQRNMRTLRLAFLSSAVLEFFASVAIAAVAIYIGFGLLGYFDFGPSAQLTLFSGLFVLLLAPDFFQPLRTLAQHYHDRAAALGAAEGLMELLAIPPPDASHFQEGRGELCRLREVSVDYPERGRVLGPLSLTLKAGECVVLTGPSGSGKTTLLNVVAGFVAPSEGETQVDRTQSFAWMDQQPFLIQGSLADNLRLAVPEASESSMRHALALAGMADVVESLPQGLYTPLSEGGGGLSGGQAQRLALARVFLSPARLVLLDEPTARLDAVSEAGIIEGLQRLIEEGRAVMIATHHPEVMSLASCVLSLEKGRQVGERVP
ncbi:thiol reductant ABC exporter subunit CydD [Litchfieldella xinjiangensis]|uniref:thiol reductant ABC exporter subunit CydD n=1 Tax=Litchfieldella xinjiangensis TaxID=1166948 RepID=UPI0005B83BC9|nr:thiol reductant ABC exporter subunit CydD [Halomonas xinjiangensis]